MSKGKGWDLTSPRSLQSAAEWIRKQSGGLLVLVVRAEDVAFAVDGQIAPMDALNMVEVAMPELHQRLTEERASAKTKKDGRRG